VRRRYRIGQKDFEALLAEQGGVCAICGTPARSMLTTIMRSVTYVAFCFTCNGGLGQLRDDVQRLN
jgi:hypothetical protein